MAAKYVEYSDGKGYEGTTVSVYLEEDDEDGCSYSDIVSAILDGGWLF